MNFMNYNVSYIFIIFILEKKNTNYIFVLLEFPFTVINIKYVLY